MKLVNNNNSYREGTLGRNQQKKNEKAIINEKDPYSPQVQLQEKV